ncbi:MAG: NAD(P)H-dependent oxidoreductase [Phycisphaerae bacterium]|nr:NAD(P)H-dependent oxidoreductase [Phycisphaerae bacterium]
MNPLVISCSLNPQSRSRTLAKAAASHLAAKGHAPEFIDIAPLGLPACDGGAAYTHPAVAPLAGKIAASPGVLLAFPIYNYDAGAAAKNLIELTGKAWTGKVVGLLAAAGGPNAFMGPLGIANSLMLDFRCLVLPRYVYAGGGEGVSASAITDPEITRRVEELAGEFLRVALALSRPA